MDRTQEIIADMAEDLAEKLDATPKQVMYMAESVAELIDTEAKGQWRQWGRGDLENIVHAYLLLHRRREAEMCERVYTNAETLDLLRVIVLAELTSD